MKNVLSKVSFDVHKEKVLLALITPHKPSLIPKLLLPCAYDTMN